MATLEDRLLGEKTHYYCSSSEDDDEDECPKIIDDSECATSIPSNGEWDGSSVNTGPKGVIKDWQRFKQLETEQRREQEKEKIALAKKLAITCRSHLDDEKDKKENDNDEDDDAVIDEEILRQYILKRMEEMMENTTIKKQFGEVLSIGNGEEFLQAVDKEDKDVTVIVHVFESCVAGCQAMNGCFISLAKDYPDIKFCRLHASDAGLSRKFQGTGVPALLVYKGGQMLGNFVRLTDEFGEDFFASDVESFLIEHGILLDRSLLPPGIKNIRGPSHKCDTNSDSE